MLVDDPRHRRDPAVSRNVSRCRHARAGGAPRVTPPASRSSRTSSGARTSGARAAASHTGAMAGTDEVANAFFRAHGIMRVDMFETLFETAAARAWAQRPPRGKRVAVVTGTGGAAAMVVDRLGVLGADVVPPSPAGDRRSSRRKDIADQRCVAHGYADGRQRTRRLHRDPVGAARVGPLRCRRIGDRLELADESADVIADRVLKAEAAKRSRWRCILAPRADNGLLLLQENGVASFRTPESCADAVNAYLNWRAPVRKPPGRE